MQLPHTHAFADPDADVHLPDAEPDADPDVHVQVTDPIADPDTSDAPAVEPGADAHPVDDDLSPARTVALGYQH